MINQTSTNQASTQFEGKNLRWPAEWEPHEATILAWPHNETDWPGKLEAISWAYAEIIRLITRYEKVILLVESPERESSVKDILLKTGVSLSQVQFLVQTTDRSWMRDSSPSYVRSTQGIHAIQFQFNGWAKYENWQLDQHIPQALGRILSVPVLPALLENRQVVLEGGAIEGNGQGTLITTEECLLHPSTQVRNPDFSRRDYETIFRNFLGVEQVLWLAEGIEGDDTHGHVDDLCRFVNQHTVVLCQESNSHDPNYRKLQENRERLQSVQLLDGSRLEVVPLPMPSPIVFDGLRLPASYANFVFTNREVLVPTFNDPNDRLALGILAELIPDREIIGVHCMDLIWGLGALHCLSHEVPKFHLEKNQE